MTHTQNYRLIALSPIHIGAGEDLEPTEYVVEEGHIHHFNLSAIHRYLPNGFLNKLGSLAEKATTTQDLLQIRGHFDHHKSHLATFSHSSYLCTAEIAQLYSDSISSHAHKGNKAINQLQIARHTYNPYSQELYIPGSSIKGTLRTLIGNALAKNQKLPLKNKFQKDIEPQAIEQILYGHASADHDPYKILKVSDTNTTPMRRFEKLTNQKRVIKDGQTQGGSIPVKVETLLAGAELSFSVNYHSQNLQQSDAIAKLQATLPNLKALPQLAKSFYNPIINTELAEMAQDNRVDSNWVKAFMQLYRWQQQHPQAFLIRLGHYAGGQTKTYANNRHIKNSKPGKDIKVTTGDRAHTYWLSSEKTPMGWALVIPQDQNTQELDNLLQPLKSKDIEKIPQLAQIKQKHLHKAQGLIANVQQRQADQAADLVRQAQQAQEEQQRVAQMTQEQKAIHTLQQDYHKAKAFNLIEPQGSLRQAINTLVNQAQNWNPQDKAQLKQLLQEIFYTYWKQDKSNKKIKELLNKLN